MTVIPRIFDRKIDWLNEAICIRIFRHTCPLNGNNVALIQWAYMPAHVQLSFYRECWDSHKIELTLRPSRLYDHLIFCAAVVATSSMRRFVQTNRLDEGDDKRTSSIVPKDDLWHALCLYTFAALSIE